MKFKLNPLVATVASALALGIGTAHSAGTTGSGASQGASAPSGSSQQTRPATVTTTAIILVAEPDFLRLDSDRDGRLSRGEVREVQQLNEKWEQADKNSDGYLTREEIREYETRLSQSGSPSSGQQAQGSRSAGSGQGSTGGSSGAVMGLDQQRGAGQTGSSGMSGSAGSSSTALTGENLLKMENSEYARLDKNNDGQLSREEAREHRLLNQQFDQVDNNNDGQVTREEVKKHPMNQSGASSPTSSGQPGMSAGSASAGSQASGTTGGQQSPATVTKTAIILVAEPDFLRLDSDRDGRLSRGEVREVQQLNEKWELADKNSDGYLTREEIREYETRLSSSGGAVMGLDQQRGAGQTGSSGMSGSAGSSSSTALTGENVLKMEASEFARLDKNNDGQLSREEARDHRLLNQQFDQVDNNNDGQVTREEVKKHPVNNPQPR